MKAKSNKLEAQGSQSTHSIFPRILFLLKHCKQDSENVNNGNDPVDSSKRELLITLITSFYLNLARNKHNKDFLLKLELFRSLTDLMLERGLKD